MVEHQGARKAAEVRRAPRADRELLLAGLLALQPFVRDPLQVGKPRRYLGGREDREAEALAGLDAVDGMPEVLPLRAFQGEAVQAEDRLLAQLEEREAVVVQERQPERGDLIEDQPAVHLLGPRHQCLQEIALLAGRDGRVAEDHEIGADDTVGAEGALAVEENRLVARRHHQGRSPRTALFVDTQGAFDLVLLGSLEAGRHPHADVQEQGDRGDPQERQRAQEAGHLVGVAHEAEGPPQGRLVRHGGLGAEPDQGEHTEGERDDGDRRPAEPGRPALLLEQRALGRGDGGQREQDDRLLVIETLENRHDPADEQDHHESLKPRMLDRPLITDPHTRLTSSRNLWLRIAAPCRPAR